MANALVRLPQLQYPENAKLDFSPITNALDSWQKQKQFDAQQAQNQQRIDMERERLGIAQKAAGQAEEDRQKQIIGGVAQYIDSLDPNDPNRAGVWDKFINSQPHYADVLKKYGGPTDHIGGPKFLLAQLRGAQDPLEQQKAQTDIEYKKALTAQANAAAGVNEESAASKRFRLYNDVLAKLGTNPTREQWDAESQPGGLVHIAFGGKAVPYSEAPRVLTQMQADFDKQFEPTEEDRIAGITRENKIKAFRERRINEMYGAKDAQLVQKGVRMTPGGDFEPRLGSSTVTERQGEVIARAALQRLEQGAMVLKKHGTLDHFFGDTRGEDPDYQWRSGYGETGRGYRSLQASIMDLNFALSGKSVTDKERRTFLSLYMPRWNESTTTQQHKLQMVRDYFAQVLRMRNAGATDDQIAETYRDRLDNPPEITIRNIPSERMPEYGGTKKKGGGKTPQDLSDEELLRELNK